MAAHPIQNSENNRDVTENHAPENGRIHNGYPANADHSNDDYEGAEFVDTENHQPTSPHPSSSSYVAPASPSTPHDQPPHAHSQRQTVPDESPELLRWRADALLDEMMMGGIDSYAASPSRATPSDADLPTNQPPYDRGPQHQERLTPNRDAAKDARPHFQDSALPYQDELSPPRERPPADSRFADGFPADAFSTDNAPRNEQNAPRKGYDPVDDRYRPSRPAPQSDFGQESRRDSHARPPANTWPQGVPNRPDAQPTQTDEPMLRPPTAVGDRTQQQPYHPSFLGSPPAPQNGNAGHEQPYEARHDGPRPNAWPQQDASHPPTSAQNFHAQDQIHGENDVFRPRDEYEQANQYGPDPSQINNGEPFSIPKETKPWAVVSGGSGDYLSSVPRRTDAPYTASQTRYTYDPVLGPTAHQPSSARFADSMAVGAQAKRRSNVWPRHSRFDIQALHQEMATLQEQIDLLVRRRLDISERAQHLLDKGRTILENDPDRSAEVTYYVQQVRNMVQRVDQRVQWSNVYRVRIFTYLTGWLALSLVVLTGCLLYGDLMRLWLSQFEPFARNSFLSQHIVAFVGTLASGILGSALAALFNAWRHSQKEYGYFDRKYGLLGTVLPIIGLLVGLLLYLVFGAIYWVFDINPVATPIAGLIPAMLTFAFGVSQERIYGTTE